MNTPNLDIALLAQHTNVAITILAKCLVANGSLSVGEYEQALRGTIESPGADTKRKDYVLLKHLLKMLEADEPPALH